MKLKKHARLLAGILAVSLATASASALTFSFSQGGFGGTISGSFSGEDVDGDGFLTFDVSSSGPDTVSAFSLLFSGGGGIAGFSLGIVDLEAVIFKIDGDSVIGNDFNLDGDQEYLAAFDAFSGNYYYAGVAYTPAGAQGEVGNYNDFAFVESQETPSVKQVPDAGSSALLLGGAMLGLFAVRRRISSRS